MKLWSDSWINGARIPALYAAGRLAPDGTAVVSDNVSPHFAWSDVPAGTQSFALIGHDFDVPTRVDAVGGDRREIPADLPRTDFFHWVLVDLPATLREIREGEYGRGFVARGKPGPEAAHGARQGLNDYTAWFAGDPARAGRYFGYDGPFPPPEDALIHHYAFTLYALAVPRAPVEGEFTGAQVREAIYPYVRAEATWSGTYTLNPRLAG